MPQKTITAMPLTAEAFQPFGDVIAMPGAEQIMINRGHCVRHHALSTVSIIGEGATTGISIFEAQPYALPHSLDLVERHPLGSQSFFPLGGQPWLVIVCSDENNTPAGPQAFLAAADQGVNIHRGVWHGVLTPLFEPANFLVVDRIGPGNNLEEVTFATPYQVEVSSDVLNAVASANPVETS